MECLSDEQHFEPDSEQAWFESYFSQEAQSVIFSIKRPFSIGNDFRIWNMEDKLQMKIGFVAGNRKNWGIS